MESYCSRRDQPWSLRTCFQEKANQNVKQWYFLKCAVSCRLTISRSLWHVRHFVSMHMIKDMCISFGAHKPNWVVRSLCFTNLCFQCECYFNLMLYTALCLFVKCDTCNSYVNKIDLIWFDLFYLLSICSRAHIMCFFFFFLFFFFWGGGGGGVTIVCCHRPWVRFVISKSSRNNIKCKYISMYCEFRHQVQYENNILPVKQFRLWRYKEWCMSYHE